MGMNPAFLAFLRLGASQSAIARIAAADFKGELLPPLRFASLAMGWHLLTWSMLANSG